MTTESIITLHRKGKTIVIYVEDWNEIPHNFEWIKDVEVYEDKIIDM